MATHVGELLCWMSDVLVPTGHVIPSKALPAAYFLQHFPLLFNLPSTVASEGDVEITRDEFDQYLVLIPSGPPVRAGQFMHAAEKQQKERCEIRDTISALDVDEVVEEALIAVLLKNSISCADALTALSALKAMRYSEPFSAAALVPLVEAFIRAFHAQLTRGPLKAMLLRFPAVKIALQSYLEEKLCASALAASCSNPMRSLASSLKIDLLPVHAKIVKV
jgi:hypothetical protein